MKGLTLHHTSKLLYDSKRKTPESTTTCAQPTQPCGRLHGSHHTKKLLLLPSTNQNQAFQHIIGSIHLTAQSKSWRDELKWASRGSDGKRLFSCTQTLLSKNIHSPNECMFAPQPFRNTPPSPVLWPPAPCFFISRFPDNAQGIPMLNPLSLSLYTPPSSSTRPPSLFIYSPFRVLLNARDQKYDGNDKATNTLNKEHKVVLQVHCNLACSMKKCDSVRLKMNLSKILANHS